MLAIDDDRLDDVFHALSNPTRRALLRILSSGPARVSELAKPFDASLNAISKHLIVLERAGLIRREGDRRTSACVLNVEPLRSADAFFAFYRRFWRGKLDQLAAYVEGETR